MSAATAAVPTAHAERTVARKKTDKKPDSKPPRERARDKGEVTPLGVEVLTTLYRRMERCQLAKKWSKRTLVEEALDRYLTAEGFPVED